MMVSGFTITRNAIKYGYPVVESIESILPICDEFVVSVGKSEDGTLDLIKSLNSPKIRIVETEWDMSEGKEVLSTQTNIALSHCRGDWAFYLQNDEIIHEKDLKRIRARMQRYVNDHSVDSFRFEWIHFYGSFYRYRDDHGWFQKQDRIIRNNGMVESFEDAYTFRRKDGKPLRRKMAGAYLYHYGWVQDRTAQAEKLNSHHELGFDVSKVKRDDRDNFTPEALRRYPIYFGSHPGVMKARIKNHQLTANDQKFIDTIYWWNPFKIFRFRYKRHRGLIRKKQK